MARLSLQIKNVASLLLATGASIAWSVASRRYFDVQPKPAGVFASVGALLLPSQLGLIFVKSKEEEELSLSRRERLAGVQQSIEENEKLSIRIQQEIVSGNPKLAEKWVAFRKDHYGR